MRTTPDPKSAEQAWQFDATEHKQPLELLLEQQERLLLSS